MSLNVKSSIISHSGYINEKIIIEKGDQLRTFFNSDIHKSRKIFSIYMELIQNIFYYSCEKTNVNGQSCSVGSIDVEYDNNKYIIKSRNKAENKFIENIKNKFPLINSLSKEQLRKLKIETRREPQAPLSKGAGIGLIQLAILSGNPLNIFFEKIDDSFSYYNIHITFSKI